MILIVTDLAMTSNGKPRGRPRKSPKASKQNLAKAAGLQILIKSNSKYEASRVEEDPESPNVEKKKRKRKEFLKSLEKKAAVEKSIALSDDDEDEDELADMRLSRRRQPIQKDSKRLIKLFDNLGTAASLFALSLDVFLSQGNVSGVKDWMDTCELDINDDRVNSVENLCHTIARILRARRTPEVSKRQSPSRGDIPIAPSDQFYTFRENGVNLALLAPIELFKTHTSIKNKTFGFVRLKGELARLNGEDPVLMTAFSGVLNVGPRHDKVLDSEVWTWVCDFSLCSPF
jgi:hypothetical protein